ncbi:MAG: hypothetical protein FWH41_10910, partial [Treponema sp.]|nr:hypothetical protein [Treponema sp.]
GVLVTGSGSSFNMEGGTISNNSSRSGGGVYTSLGCYFTMSGGTIKGNSASECGGGVFALDITKTGGIINGYTYGDTDSNTVISNGTVLNNWGHAVCVATFAERRRESTAGILVNLYSNIPGIDGGWENGNSSEVSFNVSNSLEFDTALAAIRSGSPGDYDITLTANISLAPQNFVYNAYNTKTITIKGNNAARTISLSSQGSLFTIGGLYEKIVLENIILQGIVNNTNALISVTSSGTLTMNAGAKITGNTSGSYGGVYVSGGTFNMTGGEISGNNITSKSEYDGGAGVHLDGINYNTIFTMTGGTISANTSGANGGGVYLVNSCIFNMEGGTISGNSSNLNGGGVFLRPTSGTTFTMSGGEISGNTAVQGGGVFVTYFSYNNNHFIKSGGGIIYGNNEGSNSNTAKAGNGNGHAVYWDPRYRDTTLGAVDNISNDVLSSPPWNQ